MNELSSPAGCKSEPPPCIRSRDFAATNHFSSGERGACSFPIEESNVDVTWRPLPLLGENTRELWMVVNTNPTEICVYLVILKWTRPGHHQNGLVSHIRYSLSDDRQRYIEKNKDFRVYKQHLPASRLSPPSDFGHWVGYFIHFSSGKLFLLFFSM